jgi:DNA-binding beta-propeller fold protein YncE
MKPTNRQAPPAMLRRALLASACLVAAFGANAQSTLLQQSFAGGAGAFTAAGPVKYSATGAALAAAAFTADGSLTSKAISTAGYSNIKVEFDRVTAGMLTALGDGGVAEYSVNGGAYSRLEITRIKAQDHASFTLPAAANNASITLRFRTVGVVANEIFTVNNVTVTGTPTVVDGGTGGGGTGVSSAPALGEFTTFESGHVRPMVLSADGTRLYVVNTPDAKIEVFDVTGNTPVLKESIPVGLEPVAVALAPNGQLWVVNHLSDSVSIVDVSASPARIVNTLLVGDEPRDIVFAGPNNKWAFITAAHRGQNAKFDPQFAKPGVGRADVWVFDATAPGTNLGGTPKTVLNMFGDTLRGLARNADGSRVYTAVFNSGNRTTIAQGGPFGVLAKDGPQASADGVKQPSTGLIVQKNANGDWVDGGDPARGIAPKTWNANIKLNLPDNDVFTIDTTTAVPTVTTIANGVGTTLFNMAVNPVNGKVYVSNQEARNVVRFEGPGKNSTTVNGHFVEARITVVDGTNVQPRVLNKHITSYGSGLGTAAEKAAAVATPLEMAITPDGSTLYMASMGTNKLARYATSQLESNSFTPSPANQLVLSGGLPTGVVLDAARNRAFVTTRGDNGVSVVNTDSFSEAGHVKMYNPESTDVVKGRKFMYDASYTSSRGDSSCAGCHIFGDFDHLSWDLGNPDEVLTKNTNPYNKNVPGILRTMPNFHPMKGPMNTQTFRGMKGNGQMHWRGDRTGKSTGDTLEERSFKDFSVAFPGLLGRDAPLTDDEMTSFARFVLKLYFPPNPIQPLDNTYTAAQQAGFDFYMNKNADTLTTCNGCHALDPVKGRFGTDGTMSFEGPTISENFKIPQLRNAYQKVGSFARNSTQNSPPSPQLGDQIRGYGYSADGGLGSINEFLNALVFIGVNAQNRALLQEFVLAYPSDLFPIVGQQVTVSPTNGSQTDIADRLNLLVTRAKTVTNRGPECELIAKGVVGGVSRGWVMATATGSFVSDRRSEAPVTLSALLASARSNSAPLTFTCTPPGNGTRLGIDRNGDGVPDGS